jgi:hypothetical protein
MHYIVGEFLLHILYAILITIKDDLRNRKKQQQALVTDPVTKKNAAKEPGIDNVE